MPDLVRPASAQDVESAWEQWRERLLAQFEILSDEEQRVQLYVLVDSRANPGVDKLLLQVPGLAWVSLWQDSVLESYTDIAPYLIQIDRTSLSDPRDLQSRLVRRLWKEARDLHMLTWIWSPLTLESLGSHFRHYCRYTTQDKRAFFLHFYDNRILERLRAVWAAEQARAFLSPCVEAWYRNRDLNEVVWRDDAAAGVAAIPDEQCLTVEQHTNLLQLGRADKLAMQLREMYGAILDSVSDTTLFHRVSEQLGRAARYRIADDEDLLNYVSKGLVISPWFDEHPLIQERLTRAMQGETTYRDALTGIDREVLHQASRMHEQPNSQAS
ncbi:DUF4123 domain-containing protein [Burkholderia guangdongensis]|uniref:DUF4123 domain-containing protein n=1 Tax=Burkholderia guangdongensis TaxID=1792500 RepID=UPI0015C78812|nr:DUF4123 domain-containing protein [Burkholderia guangdongensis]